jgi:hypothetical protein
MFTQATTPPPARLLDLTIGGWVSQALSVAADLRVADELASGPRPVGQLATAVGADAPSLYRLLRALATVDVFEELSGRRFALTALGELLRSDVPGSMRSWAILVGRPFHQHAWNQFVDSVQTGEPAFDRAYGRTPWDYFRDHPEDGELMNAAMTAISSQLVTPVVEAYDFSRFGMVVDIGGGHGALLTAILTANPKTRGVLYDLPHVIAGAEPKIAAAGLGDCCECVAGDFFESVPPGGDAYLLSNIIHDWDDDRCVRILANCRTAMAGNGRVLLGEWVLPDHPDDDGPSLPAWADLEMLAMTSGGRQRTEAELDQLFRRAGLRLSRIVPTPTSDAFCVVEGVPVGQPGQSSGPKDEPA